MANTLLKRYSTLLLIKEVQIKITRSHHYDLMYPAEWLKLKRQTVPTVNEDAEQGNSLMLLERM